MREQASALDSPLHEVALWSDVLWLVARTQHIMLDVEVREERRLARLLGRYSLAGARVAAVDGVGKCLIHVPARERIHDTTRGLDDG